MSREFTCEREVLLPASAEQVWDAIATTEGLACWLFPMPVPELGDGATSWVPPHHLAVRMEQGEWFNELEYVIERQGTGSILRYVHHGIFVDDWDTQYDAVQQHTDFYLHTLGQYLKFFAGQSVTFVGEVPEGIQGPIRSADPDGFERFKQALGIAPGIRAGEVVNFQCPDATTIEGVVDYAQPNFLGVRTVNALYCFFGRNVFGQSVGMTIHQFGEAVDSDAIASQWRVWLDEKLG